MSGHPIISLPVGSSFIPKEKLKEKIGDTSGTVREDDLNHSNEVIVGKHGKTIEKSDDDLSPKCNKYS